MHSSDEPLASFNGKRRILVADDERVNREFLRAMLQEEYEVVPAENGEEALRQIRNDKARLSLVLLDIDMPGMTGLEVLREMRKDPELSGLPVIVVPSGPGEEEESLKLGAVDTIAKPYPAAVLIRSRIARAIAFCETRGLVRCAKQAMPGAFPHGHERSREYYAIAQALASDFESIYYVNIHTDAYTEFTARGAYEELQIELSGTDFFGECQKNLRKVAYPEDLDFISAVMEKDVLLGELYDNQVFHVVYRLMIEGNPIYYRLKAVLDEEKEHLVIGVSNVHKQIKGEQELAAIRNKANRDALTGVKSKHAYMDDVDKINREIEAHTAEPFSVAICDINGLKSVNDRQGHQAGDQLIKDACSVICNVFQHSPVYRIGGDEFVAILRNQDHLHRELLMAQMEEVNQQHKASGSVMIACGLSEWKAGEDEAFDTVFKRADEKMYLNKTALKED